MRFTQRHAVGYGLDDPFLCFSGMGNCAVCFGVTAMIPYGAGGRRLVWSLLKSLCGGPRCPVAIAKRRRPTNHYARLWTHYI